MSRTFLAGIISIPIFHKKPMIVIDLGSGSFVRKREGHEFFNLLPNSILSV